MDKKKGLPEIVVTKDTYPDLVRVVKQAQDLRAQIAALMEQEEDLKRQISEKASDIRVAEESQEKYIGVVKVVGQDMAPAQVQFRINSGFLQLGEEEGPTLDHHFQGVRPLLWGQSVWVKAITNPDNLIAEIRNRGQNPWDFLDIKVKKDLDRAVVDSPNVAVDKAFLPLEGFLATLNEVASGLTSEAKKYVGEYLGHVLKPVVSLGHK